MIKVLTTCSKNGVDAINNLTDSVALKYHEQKINGAWTHKYHMTDVEIKWLQMCFPRFYVYPFGPYKHSEHPVLAALNQYCNEDAAKQVAIYRTKGLRTMTIGDSVDCNIKADHNCLLLNSSREDYRIACTTNDSYKPHVVLDLETNHCVSGSENCFYKADHGFAVHSVYDMSMRDVAQVFANHSLQTLTCYMYFTTTLMKGNHVDPFPFFYVQNDGVNSKFVMCDESIIYTHDTAKWQAWHNTTSIECADFNLIFEVVRSYGPLRIIKIVRVRKNVLGNVSRCVPLTKIFPDSVLVPDMYAAVKMGFRVEQKNLKHFVVPLYIVTAIMAYIQRAADEGYKFPEIATYWSGIIRRITIGDNIVQESFVAPPEVLYRILIALFLLGALQRTDRTKTISEAFSYIKSHIKLSGVCGYFQVKLQKFLNRFGENARSWQANKDLKITSDCSGLAEYGFWFEDFRIIPVTDYEVNENHKFDCMFNKISSDLPPSIKNLESVSRDVVDDCLDPTPDPKQKDIIDTPAKIVDKFPPIPKVASKILPSIPKQPKVTPVSFIDKLRYRLARKKRELIINPGASRFLYNIDAGDSQGDSVNNSEKDKTTGDSVNNSEKDKTTTVNKNVKLTSEQLKVRDGRFRRKITTASLSSEDEIFIRNLFNDDESDGSETVESVAETTEDSSGWVTTDDDDSASTSSAINNPPPAGILYQGANFYDWTSNPKLSSGVWKGDVPNRFLVGHCAIESFYTAGQKAGYLSPTLDVRFMLQWVANCLMEHLPNNVKLNRTIIDAYITCGNFTGSDISNIALELLAQSFKLNVYIISVAKWGQNSCYLYGDAKRNILIYHTGDHFTAKPIGGAIRKYVEILQDLNLKTHPRVLDLSCAPGFVTKHLRSRGFNVFSGYYKGRDYLKINKSIKPDFIYDDISQLFSHLKAKSMKFDVIINDIGRPVNSEAIIDMANETAIQFLNDGGYLYTKTFANPHHLWSMKCWSDITLPYESKTCTERIFRCVYQQGRDINDFYKYYDRPGWNRRITVHVIPTQDHYTFSNLFFNGKLGDLDLASLRPSDTNNDPEGTTFEVDCLSGFASASKTTYAIKHYRNAVFIAPSLKLRDEHLSRGVMSYTPHMFFSTKNDFSKYTHVVVDEAFQMNVCYFSLINHVYPKLRIVCLGDVHQTPACDFIKAGRFNTLYDYGLRNNLIDVYKMPKDVVESVNKTLGFNIRTHSNISKSIYTYIGKLDKLVLSKLPIIVFNHATCERLIGMGANAHTITTYTGSRAPIVVFYIDSASIESQLLAKSKYVYTALSRHTDALVLFGDVDGLVKRYNIAPTPISKLEDIMGIHISHAIDLPEENEVVPTVAPGLHRDVGSKKVAQAIISNVLHPVNDPSGDFISTATLNVPTVESGKLRINKDMLHDYGKESTVHRLQEQKFAKHQMSNNVLEGVQTLVKRYSRKYNTNDKRDMEYTLTELLNGLSMAIYGNEHSIKRLRREMFMSVEYISKRQREYIDKLNTKLKDKTIMAEIDQVCKLNEEQLKFFNKRQSKFDPKDGFDTSDKVGQGVAATSKRINVLFCGWARALLDRIRELLARNNRNIILATHDSDTQMNARYVQMISKFEKLHDFTCNDFSEWDASFRIPFVKLTSWLLIASGCPRNLVNTYEKFRESWTMQYRTIWGFASLDGFEKQFSGNPFTICENTIGNMALCFSLFEYKDFQFAYFKGDDSAVNCSSSRMYNKAKQILNYTGHKLKLHNSPIGEFAGWFLTDQGLFPDVVRHTAKFLDKLYVDEDHFKEVVMSLQERCAAVVTSQQLFTGAATCALFYNELYEGSCFKTRLSSEDVQSLFHFLKNSRYIEFGQLYQTKMASFKV